MRYASENQQRRIRLIVLGIFLTSLMQANGVADASQDAPTSMPVKEITVFKDGQALITRRIDIDLPTGTSELIVQNLPAMIVPESIYAQTSDATKVLSVRYRERAVREDTREEVKQLDTQIEAVQHKLKYAKEQLDLNAQQWKMYENLKDFTVTAERTDLNKGVLVYEPVQNLTELIEQKGTEYLERKLELEDEMSESQKELDLLERKRNKLVAGQSRTDACGSIQPGANAASPPTANAAI